MDVCKVGGPRNDLTTSTPHGGIQFVRKKEH